MVSEYCLTPIAELLTFTPVRLDCSLIFGNFCSYRFGDRFGPPIRPVLHRNSIVIIIRSIMITEIYNN